MYFQTLSAWVLRFRAYDTRYLHFRGMSSWSNCRSLFWNREVTLVKLLIFTKWAFTAIVQIYFQSFSQWFIGFTAYDTGYRQFFFEYQTWTIPDHSFEWHNLWKTVIFLKENFRCYHLNVFSKLRWTFCMF